MECVDIHIWRCQDLGYLSDFWLFPRILVFPIDTISCTCRPKYWYQTDHIDCGIILGVQAKQLCVCWEGTKTCSGRVSTFKLIYSLVIASSMREMCVCFHEILLLLHQVPCTWYTVPDWLHAHSPSFSLFVFSLSLCLSPYIYIYIYIEREWDREKEIHTHLIP